MKKGRKIFLIISAFLIFSFISASFESGDLSYSIEKQYAPNDPIKGWINISLNNEPGSSLFVDSFDNKISLTELLNLNSGSGYTCFPNDCQSDYSENNAETSKTFNLNPGETKIIGLKLTGENFESISTALSMNISSTIGESNFPQFYIDILSDDVNGDKIEWVSHVASNNFYNEKNGCYETPDEIIWIKDQRFCEKINISIAPNVEIGAYVIEDTGGTVDFNLDICDANNNCGFCVATASNTGRISCIVDYQINEEQDFFVCIKAKNFKDNTNYSINSETNEACGYAGSESNKRDFEIFAKPGKYSAPGEFTLNNNEIQASGKNFDLKFDIEEYIESRYNNDCSNTCIIPIKFISGEGSQTITISNINMHYDVSGITRQVTKVYDLTEIAPKITSDFQILNLDNANLSVSGNFDENITYSLKFNDEQIFSEDILIKRIPRIVSLNNRKIIAAYPAEFIVKIETFGSSKNITEYKWEFGDGTISTTSENKTTHTYRSIGLFELKVSITDSSYLTSSKIFNITVSTPKDSVEIVLKNKLDNLNKINSQIEKFPVFHKNSLNSALNLKEIEEEISGLQQRNLTALGDEDYVSIMNDLVKLNIPESVFVTKSISSFGFYPDKNKINLKFLGDIDGSGYDIDKKIDYIDSIILWNLENINAEINSKEFSTIYEDSIEFVLNVFEINVKENKANENSFLIIPRFDDIVFKENYGAQEKSEYIYIELTGESNEKIEFSTTENLDFSVLPVFISPRIEELVLVSGKISEIKEKLSDQTLAILVVLLITFIGVIAYIIIQEWYKKKYENYLFKNKNSLYNLILYIKNAKEKNMKAKEIASKLKDAGWSSEQVRYIMRKYVGKRTGMFEIPTEKILNFLGKKEKANIAKRKFPPRRN